MDHPAHDRHPPPRDERHDARLLLAIVREDWAAAEALRAGGPPEPARFVRLARECDVHPWLHARLEREGRLELVGDAVARRLGELRARCRADNMLLLAQTERALDALLGAGVVPVALKGLDVLHRLHERFDERSLDDVDLLVRPGELGRALAALEDAGWSPPPAARRDHYLRSSHHLPLDSPGPVTVGFEVHWNLVQEQRYRLDPEELFRRAVPLEVAGRPVLRLDDHDFTAHLLLHHFTHYFDRRLKWSIDLRPIVAGPDFDWARVAQVVRAWGAGAAVGMSVLHLHKLFPGLITADVRRRLPVAAWRRLLTLPLRSAHPLDLFRGTRRRRVQLYLAAVMLENPLDLPGWLRHRKQRGARPELDPLAREHAGRGAETRRPE